jgi:lariat debranching enzyme
MSNEHSINIAVQGCCHGELDRIYETIRESETTGIKVDLLLICGDFECVRDFADL